MSRSNSVERDGKPRDKPLPAVPSLVESTNTTATERLAQTLKKMSQDIPTSQYKSPLNIAGRIKNELADMTRDIPVPLAGRATHHRDRYDHHHREPEVAHSGDPDSSGHLEGGDGGERITSAEKIRRRWEESQKSPERKASSHHKSSSSGDLSRHRSPPTSFRSGDGFPWAFGSREHGQPSRHGSFRSKHRRERSAEAPPQETEVYDHSDGSGGSSIRLEIHNATPIYEHEGTKSRGRPGLTTRFRSSLQRIGVGSTRPARERTDISRSPSPTGRRSPSPDAWRKRSPHSSIRATEQYSTPRTAGLPDALPRIESQKMTLDWEQPIDNTTQSPARPPDDVIPTIPDLVTPGIHHENGPRGVPILEPEKPRPVEIEQLPSHWLEPSQATSTTAVDPPAPHNYPRAVMDDHPVVRNFDGPYHSHESHNEGPGRLKRLLSLSSKPVPVPIEGDDDQPSRVAPLNIPPKVYTTPVGIIRSTSLIRTRSRRKDSTKRREQRVDPDTHVGYESDPWGEGQEIHRDAQGNRIFPQAPKRKTSQKKKPVPGAPTKIALPMGQVEEFHSVHSNSPTEPVPPDIVSTDPMMLGVHKRTTSTTTFHTAQSGATRPGSPTRKLPPQAKPSAADPKHDGWRRSRAGAPRRPSQTLLSATYSNGNQYADEAPILHDHQPLFGEPQQEYEQDHPENLDDLSALPHYPPATDHRSQSPMPHGPTVHTHGPEPHAYGPPPPLLPPSPPPLAPAPVYAPTPGPASSSARSPAPAPARSPAPAPARSPAPAPARSPAPAPARSPAPVPARSPAPAPARSPAPAPTPSRSPGLVPASASPPAPAPLPAYSVHAPTSAHASPTFMSRPLPEQPRPLPEKPPLAQDPPMSMPVPAIPTYDPPSRTNSPPIRTPPPPPPHDPLAPASPEQSPPIRTPRAQTPTLGEHIQIYPSEHLPGESYEYEDPRHHPRVDTHLPAGPDIRSPAIDTPYELPRRPTPTLTSPGVFVNHPSMATSPTIDHQLSPRPPSPTRSVQIEYEERGPTSSMLSNRPVPRQLAGLSLTEQQQRQQNRQTGSEMSFVNVEPLTKREKLAASVLSISSMPWRRNRTFSRSHLYSDSPYHSTHDEDSRYYDRHRQPTDYLSSPTAPQLPPVHTTPPRPEVGKLPSWYPREQTARAAASNVSQQRESRGPRIGQEAWGWRSSPHHGIPEETEETTPTNMPPWPYASGVVTAPPELANDLVRGESMMTPPILPPRPAARTPEPAVRPSGEKKRVPKYRIEQDERGHPVLVPEPGFDDSRWTVFEIGGVEFKRAPGTGENTRGGQWVPKRLSGLRRPYEQQYSDSPGPIHPPLEGRQYDT